MTFQDEVEALEGRLHFRPFTLEGAARADMHIGLVNPPVGAIDVVHVVHGAANPLTGPSTVILTKLVTAGPLGGDLEDVTFAGLLYLVNCSLDNWSNLKCAVEWASRSAAKRERPEWSIQSMQVNGTSRSMSTIGTTEAWVGAFQIDDVAVSVFARCSQPSLDEASSAVLSLVR